VQATGVSDPLITSVLTFIAGRDRPAWLVGGFVRDLLLGRPIHDVDLVVPDGGIELARAVANAFQGAFFVLDEERDVARTILGPDEARLTVDVARLRGQDLAADLALRDFTVNAMAMRLPNPEAAGTLAGWEIVDLFGGRDDLRLGLLRVVGPQAFRDDPLRTLRGVRQAAELGLHLEASTAALIRRDGHLLSRVSAERIRDELVRIVGAPGAWKHIRVLAELDLLRPTLPEVQALIGVPQSEPHYLDVFDHTRAVVAHAEGVLALLWPEGPFTLPAATGGDRGAEESLITDEAAEPVQIAPDWQWEELAAALAPFAADLRAHLEQPLAIGRSRRDRFAWAALAHDWGKATTATVGSDWRVHFYRHEQEGAVLVENRARLLALSANEADYLAQLVELHMRPGHLAGHYPPSRRALYRFFRDARSTGPEVVLLSIADKMATRAPQAEEDGEYWHALLDAAGQTFTAYFREGALQANPELLLDGKAVMAELGLAPGPEIGRLLADLREAQAVGEITTEAEARAWLHNRETPDAETPAHPRDRA
jgi:tRNA nucleotidyltransferase/poly(A) polymerase